MLRPKLIPKPKTKYSQRQNNYKDPQLEIRIQVQQQEIVFQVQETGNIMQETAQRMIPKTPVS
jgi:hypothetical protein